MKKILKHVALTDFKSAPEFGDRSKNGVNPESHTIRKEYVEKNVHYEYKKN